MHNYYTEQAGSGLGGYSGIRYQKGHGWFGRIIKGGIVPILKRVLPYLGKRALETGVGVAQDVMDGENFKSSAKKRFKATGQRIEDDVITKARNMSGSGLRRKRKRLKSVTYLNKRRKPSSKKKQKSSKRKPLKTKRKTIRKKSKKKVSFF